MVVRFCFCAFPSLSLWLDVCVQRVSFLLDDLSRGHGRSFFARGQAFFFGRGVVHVRGFLPTIYSVKGDMGVKSVLVCIVTPR